MIKRLLILSLVVNATLLALVMWHQPRTSSKYVPTAADGDGAQTGSEGPATTSAKSRAKRNSPWSKIENGDIREFMANLRAAGCPEQTIRDIATLRICRKYRQRVLQNEIDLARKQSGNAVLDPAEWTKVREETQNIRDDMISELESVLGDDWRTLTGALTGFPYGGDGLNKLISKEKLAQAREVGKQYRHDLDELNRKAMMGTLEPGEASKFRELQRQKQTALAAILSPQELEEYLYRDSPAAEYVKRNLPDAKNESEYRAMVKLALEMEMSDQMDSSRSYAARYGTESDDSTKERDQRKKDYEQRLKEMLGEDRISEQKSEEQARAQAETEAQKARDKARMQSEMVSTAVELGVSEQGAKLFFQKFSDAEGAWKKKFEEIEKNLTGTAVEKQKQMETLIKAELNGLAKETMGEKGPSVIDKLFEKHR